MKERITKHNVAGLLEQRLFRTAHYFGEGLAPGQMVFAVCISTYSDPSGGTSIGVTFPGAQSICYFGEIGSLLPVTFDSLTDDEKRWVALARMGLTPETENIS